MDLYLSLSLWWWDGDEIGENGGGATVQRVCVECDCVLLPFIADRAWHWGLIAPLRDDNDCCEHGALFGSGLFMIDIVILLTLFGLLCIGILLLML